MSMMGEPLSPFKGGSLPGNDMMLAGITEPGSFLEQHNEAHFLASLLADEKQRCNQHKENYTLLKNDHRKLKNELLSAQEEILQLSQDKNRIQDRHAEELGAYDAQITALRQTVTELQNQMPAKDKIDALKTQMISDVESPFRKRLDDLQTDNDSMRADNAKLKHDFAFLKTEYEHTLQRHKSTLEDLKLQHQAEVDNLLKDKDDLIRRLHADSSGDMQRMHTLQKENTSLNQRLKSVLQELDEIRSQREKVGLESDHVQRIQNKQFTEFQANLKGLEVEKETLRKQVDSQAREVSMLLDNQTDITKRLFEEEQKTATLRNQLEAAKHEANLNLTQQKLDTVKSLGQVEKERDSLRSRCEDLKSQLEARQSAIAQLENSVRETERQCADKISSIREEEFTKFSETSQDRQNLESRVHILERQKVDLEERLHQDSSRHEHQLRDQQTVKDQLEKELITLRAKIHNNTQAQTDLDYERNRGSEQRTQLMKLEAENQALRTSEAELSELITSLRHKCGNLHEEIRRVTEKESANSNTAEKVLAQHKSVWSDEKNELKKRIDQLEMKMKESRDALNMETAAYNKKKAVYTKLVEKLRRKMEISEAEKDEMKLQVESVKGFIPPEVHHQIRKELKELKNRHKEYKNIMLAGDINHVPIGNLSFAAASVHNTPFDVSPIQTPDVPELTNLMKRMDKLDEDQRRQMSGLGMLSPDISISTSSVIQDQE